MNKFVLLGEVDGTYDPDVANAHTAQFHWSLEVNDPYEPYQGVAALFNADLHTGEPGWAPREDWMIVSPHVIRMARENLSKP